MLTKKFPCLNSKHNPANASEANGENCMIFNIIFWENIEIFAKDRGMYYVQTADLSSKNHGAPRKYVIFFEKLRY